MGFKGCGTNYLYNEKVSDTGSFNNYFQTSLDHKEITNSVAHLDLGLGFSHQWFYMINLRAGVLCPLERPRWNINNNKVALIDDPGIRYQGYITLSLGLGYLYTDRMKEDMSRKILRNREQRYLVL